jgi:chromosome segregation ATPase
MAKGGVNEASKYFQTKNTSKLSNEFKRLEEENIELKQALETFSNNTRNKDEELKYLRALREEQQVKIKALNSDLGKCPTVSDL